MKYLFLLFISFTALAQDTLQSDSISLKVTHENARIVVKTEGPANVVYRGITNKINIAVAGVPDWDVTVSAPGIFKHSGTSGIFEWNVTQVSGRIAKLNVAARLPNGERKVEQIEFQIRNIPPLYGTINGQGCDKCIVQQTLAELKDGVVSIGSTPAFITENIKIKQFALTLPTGKEIVVNGDKINMFAYNLIKELKSGAIMTIDDIVIEGRSNYSGTNYIIKILLAE